MSDSTGTVVAQRYQVRRMIGEGAMGSVYAAHKFQSPDTACALKKLGHELTHDPRFGRRFTEEARSLGKLAHPSIVELYEFFRDGEGYFIALAYIDGM